eukprot:5019444-Amphidinium_carterae.2
MKVWQVEVGGCVGKSRFLDEDDVRVDTRGAALVGDRFCLGTFWKWTSGPADFPASDVWLVRASAASIQGAGGSRCCSLVDAVDGVVVAGVVVAV